MPSTTALVPTSRLLPAQESELLGYLQSADSENTIRAYESDWRSFTEWCQRNGRQTLPADPETLALFLVEQARTLKVATLQRRLSAVGRVHRDHGHDNPASHPGVARVWRGIRRDKGVAPDRKSPITGEELRACLSALPDSAIGVRDAAIILVGFHAALRRSEIVGLDFEDVTETSKGVRLSIRRSKTDQEGEGQEIGLMYQSDPAVCPVRALSEWVTAAGIGTGPVFRPVDRHGNIGANRLAPKAVALVIKRAADAAGLDASQFSGHSLRSGLVTQAASDGAPERIIAQQTRHRSMAVLRTYIRHGSVFRENVGTFLRL